MGIFDRLRPDRGTGQPELTQSSSAIAGEKNGVGDSEPSSVDGDLSRNIKVKAAEDSDDNDELVHKDMQPGVQKIEGMAQVWPKWALYFTYVW